MKNGGSQPTGEFKIGKKKGIGREEGLAFSKIEG